MELFEEILQYHQADFTLTEKYKRLYALLDRVCKQLSTSYEAESSTLFSRLHAVCKHTNYRRNQIDLFRLNAKRIIRQAQIPDSTDYLYDLKALCEAISHFYNASIPPNLQAILPTQ